MSEENQSVEEVVTESTEQSATTSPDVGLIAESKKYRTRAQTAEAELGKLQKKLEMQEKCKAERAGRVENISREK